jgi:hypothetical protein
MNKNKNVDNMKKTLILSAIGILVLVSVAGTAFYVGLSMRGPVASTNGSQKTAEKEKALPLTINNLNGEVVEVRSSSLVVKDSGENVEFSEREVKVSDLTKFLINIKKSQTAKEESDKKMAEESAAFNEQLAVNEKKILACPNALVSSVPSGVVAAETVPASDKKVEESAECKSLREEHTMLVGKLNDIYLKYFKDYETTKDVSLKDVRVGDRVVIYSKDLTSGKENIAGKKSFEAGSVEIWR